MGSGGASRQLFTNLHVPGIAGEATAGFGGRRAENSYSLGKHQYATILGKHQPPRFGLMRTSQHLWG